MGLGLEHVHADHVHEEDHLDAEREQLDHRGVDLVRVRVRVRVKG